MTTRTHERHNMSRTSEYRTWAGMIERCHNPNCPGFKRYGGRGISVCGEWQNSFTSFFLHVGKKPSPQHSLDRINNNGNYEPGNVRWATKEVQTQNRRSNVVITIGSVSLCASVWAKRYGITPQDICQRMKRGWSAEEAITTPVVKTPQRKNRRYGHDTSNN